MLDFLNSKTGIFAAIVGVMGLAGALWRFYVDITDRRAKSAEKKAADKRSGQDLPLQICSFRICHRHRTLMSCSSC
jgi:hypothetical protein